MIWEDAMPSEKVFYFVCEDIGLPTLRTTKSIGYVHTLTRFGNNKAVPTVATTITGGARKNRVG
jgi:hypothetical protein